MKSAFERQPTRTCSAPELALPVQAGFFTGKQKGSIFSVPDNPEAKVRLTHACGSFSCTCPALADRYAFGHTSPENCHACIGGRHRFRESNDRVQASPPFQCWCRP